MGLFSRVKVVYLVIPAIFLFYFLALDSMVEDSPTMDEQNHLARGLALLRTGDPRFSLEHPPLVNVINALPLLTVPGIELPTDHASWNQTDGWYAFAEELLWNYNHDVSRMIFLGRLFTIYLTLALALVGYRYGFELWGKMAGLVAFLFLLFDPNILAHGRYITTDLGGTLFIFLASLLLWRLWSDDGWQWGKLIVAGLSLGLAFGSKMSNLVFGLIFVLMALLPLYRGSWSWEKAGRRVAQYLVAGLVTLPVIWALYAFQWGSFHFSTELLSRLNNIPGPMPTYWAGIERISLLSEGGRPGFLLGETSVEGWWNYFPVAFGVKTPVIILILILLSAIVLLRQKSTRGRAAYLLIPVVLFFAASMQSGLNIGYRHLLPILPFCYVLISGTTSLLPSLKRSQRRVVEAVVFGSILLLTIIAVILHPNYLSYFNVFAGGPANGHKVLVDSNIDWGQDLIRLAKWVEENDVQDLKLAWFGSADPDYYGIEYDPLPGLPRHFDLWWNPPFDTDNPEPGTYAISVSNLWEIPLEEKTVFSWFREREPDLRIGYSIYIYEVE